MLGAGAGQSPGLFLIWGDCELGNGAADDREPAAN